MKNHKILEALRTVDEVQILELLDISTEDLLLKFKDKIGERKAYLEKELELENLEEVRMELNFEEL